MDNKKHSTTPAPTNAAQNTPEPHKPPVLHPHPHVHKPLQTNNRNCIHLKHGESMIYKPKMRLVNDFFNEITHNIPFDFPPFMVKILPNRNPRLFPTQQCILVPFPTGNAKNILHVVGHETKTSKKKGSFTANDLVITSQPIDKVSLAAANSCPELCNQLKAMKQDCMCVTAQTPETISDFDLVHNGQLRYGIKTNLQMYTSKNLPGGKKYVTAMNSNVGFELFELFSGHVKGQFHKHKKHVLKLALAPQLAFRMKQKQHKMIRLGEVSQKNILVNELNENIFATLKFVSVSENHPEFSYGQRVEMIAEPLIMYHSKMQQKLMRSCLIGHLPLGEKGQNGFINSCSVELDAAFDYTLKIINIGKETSNLKLITSTKEFETRNGMVENDQFWAAYNNEMNSFMDLSRSHFYQPLLVIGITLLALMGACTVFVVVAKQVFKSRSKKQFYQDAAMHQNTSNETAEYSSGIEVTPHITQ